MKTKIFTWTWYLCCFCLGINAGTSISEAMRGNIHASFGYGIAAMWCGAYMISIHQYERLHVLAKKFMKLNDDILDWIEKFIKEKEAVKKTETEVK